MGNVLGNRTPGTYYRNYVQRCCTREEGKPVACEHVRRLTAARITGQRLPRGIARAGTREVLGVSRRYRQLMPVAWAVWRRTEIALQWLAQVREGSRTPPHAEPSHRIPLPIAPLPAAPLFPRGVILPGNWKMPYSWGVRDAFSPLAFELMRHDAEVQPLYQIEIVNPIGYCIIYLKTLQLKLHIKWLESFRIPKIHMKIWCFHIAMFLVFPYSEMRIFQCWNFSSLHGENFMAIFTTLSVVIWFSTGTLGVFRHTCLCGNIRHTEYDNNSHTIDFHTVL